jgi:hypothetical protein
MINWKIFIIHTFTVFYILEIALTTTFQSSKGLPIHLQIIPLVEMIV